MWLVVETLFKLTSHLTSISRYSDLMIVSAAKFARDCLKKMKEIVVKLEVTLGPDTADLDLRVGLHRYGPLFGSLSGTCQEAHSVLLFTL